LETKNCIVSEKTAPTGPTQTTLVWFEFYFTSQLDQTTSRTPLILITKLINEKTYMSIKLMI